MLRQRLRLRRDVLINNGAAYIEGDDLADVSDDTIESVTAAGGTGTVLLTKHLLPLLHASSRPDVVNMISACGEVGTAVRARIPRCTRPSMPTPGSLRFELRRGVLVAAVDDPADFLLRQAWVGCRVLGQFRVAEKGHKL